MLTVKTAYTRSNKKSSRWIETDISSYPMKQLEALFGDVIVVVNIPSLEPLVKQVWVSKLTTLPQWGSAKADITISDWLASIGETTLPYEPAVANLDKVTKRTQYAHLFHHGYNVRPVDRVTSVDSGGSNATKSDLYITKKGVSGTVLGTYGLYTVNGYFHIADYDQNAVYLHDGNTTVRKCNQNEIGVLSWRSIGKIRQYPITDSMISGLGKGTPLSDGLYVTLTKEQMASGKTFLFVFGGFLHVLDDTYDRVGERTFKVHISKLNIVERYFSSMNHLDYSTLKLADYTKFKNPSLISVNEALSDENIRSYMKLSQTFVVAVDAERLYTDVEPLPASLPGRIYLESSQFDHSLVTGTLGRVMDYHPIIEDDQTILACPVNVRENYTFYGRPWLLQGAVDNKRDPNDPFSHVDYYKRIIAASY